MKQSAEVIIAGPCTVDQWAGQHASFQPSQPGHEDAFQVEG